jgi:D-psicose/D-tagatose/L-ribulose 3-epimerase
MKLGCCTSLDHISQLREAGISCIELNANSVEALSQEAFETLCHTLSQEKTIAADSANCLFPGSAVPLFQDTGLKETEAYLKRLLPRLGRLGIKYLVFGSGAYRKAPEGLSQNDIKNTVCAFLTLLCKMAAQQNISIVIEPLNQSETNVINTTSEAIPYLDELKLPNLFLLVDLYHFEREGEALSKIEEYASVLRHVHIANPDGRGVPSLKDQYDYTEFFRRLRKIGYQGIVSLEYTSKDGMFAEELRLASELFRMQTAEN